MDEEDSDDNEEVDEDMCVFPREEYVALSLALDPGMWLNMLNMKPPYLPDLEIESMKKLILDCKRYSRKCPRQLSHATGYLGRTFAYYRK